MNEMKKRVIDSNHPKVYYKKYLQFKLKVPHIVK